MLFSRHSCCQGVPGGGCVEAVWPHHLAEPTAVEFCGSQGVQLGKQRDRNGNLVQGRGHKILFSWESSLKKGYYTQPVKGDECLTLYFFCTGTAACGHYMLVQSRPVPKSCKTYIKVWYQEEKKGICGLFFKLIIHKGPSGLMCKQEKLEKYLEGKRKLMHRNKFCGKDLRTS